jgi:TPR repeat protein
MSVRVVAAGVLLSVVLGTGKAGQADVLRDRLADAEQRLAARFASRGLAYPPRRIALVALKSEARLELWADAGGRWGFVRSYLVRAASGGLGPKLREGDHQVPEGVYRIEALNPTSRYHLSLRVDYPNAFDRVRAAEDGRAHLGGDIMIHGGAVSDGCLPVGDAAIEELFALVERVGTDDVPVIVSPLDFRRADPRRAQARAAQRPVWLPELYASIATALEPFALLPPEERAAPVRPRTRQRRAGCRPYDERDCLRRCETGDVASCARAGLMYAVGLGVAADATRAWSFLRQACDGGDAFGCAELARLYLTDDGPRRNAARAAELAGRACEGGDGHGCSYLARLCAERIIYPATRDECGSRQVRRLRESAVASLRTDCRGWAAYDCASLADIYYPADPGNALRFAAGACDGGVARGCYTLARLAEDGGDGARAATLYARSCRRGHPPACERERTAAPWTIAASR